MRGWVSVGLTVRTMRNLEGDEVKVSRAVSNVGRRLRREANRDAMSSIVCVCGCGYGEHGTWWGGELWGNSELSQFMLYSST